jgi:hypothetical protein
MIFVETTAGLGNDPFPLLRISSSSSSSSSSTTPKRHVTTYVMSDKKHGCALFCFFIWGGCWSVVFFRGPYHSWWLKKGSQKRVVGLFLVFSLVAPTFIYYDPSSAPPAHHLFPSKCSNDMVENGSSSSSSRRASRSLQRRLAGL